MSERRRHLLRAHLYLVCDARPDAFLDRALRGGVDIVQLRVKDAPDEEILGAARRFAMACAAHDALFVLNDRPELVAEAGADGVHVGQDDLPVPRARELVGPDRLVGLSTHSLDQIRAANGAGVDYIGVGPVHATPTKPGPRPVGLELVRDAAREARMPFFAIGGIDLGNVHAVTGAGAERIAVVRALSEAADVESSARELRAELAGERTPVAGA